MLMPPPGSSGKYPPKVMKTPRSIIIVCILPALLSLPSCQDPAERMGKGFRLPEGNAERGKMAFLELKCHQCHTVAAVSLPNADAPSPIAFELGGEVRKVKSYGELVTAIIQPQHIISPDYLAKLGTPQPGAASPMPTSNDTMTVTQLTDIVTFLHGHYQKAPPPGRTYPYYLP